MAKLIVKPTINFLSVQSDSRLTVQVGAIIRAMMNNPNYLNPYPTLETVSAALQAFVASISKASMGGILLTAAKNARRAELVSLVRQLASYVVVACKGDLVHLMESGFPIHKPTRHAIGRLRSPRIPILRHGKQTGQLNASTKSIRGVRIYNWRLALASLPDVFLEIKQTTSAKGSFSGLTPGQIYLVDVNAVGTAGTSDWSGKSRLMVV